MLKLGNLALHLNSVKCVDRVYLNLSMLFRYALLTSIYHMKSFTYVCLTLSSKGVSTPIFAFRQCIKAGFIEMKLSINGFAACCTRLIY